MFSKHNGGSSSMKDDSYLNLTKEIYYGHNIVMAKFIENKYFFL